MADTRKTILDLIRVLRDFGPLTQRQLVDDHGFHPKTVRTWLQEIHVRTHKNKCPTTGRIGVTLYTLYIPKEKQRWIGAK